jgi:hypothetical protein
MLSNTCHKYIYTAISHPIFKPDYIKNDKREKMKFCIIFLGAQQIIKFLYKRSIIQRY